MDRREYLTRTGSVGVLALVAGCLGSSSDGSVAPAADRTGDRALDRAVGRLNRAAIELEDSDGLDDVDAVSFNAAEPRDLVVEARDALETAAAELDAESEPDVAELRAYADVLEGTIDVTETVADDTVEDDAAAVTSVVEADGDIDDATRAVDDRNATLDAARDDLDAAQTGLDDLDRDRLDELSIVDLTAVDNGVETLDDVLSSMITLGAGYETMLEGYDAFETAETKADAENHDAAIVEFGAAESMLETARMTFDDGIDDSPSGLEPYFETARCQSGGLATAAGHFEASTAATADHDQQTATSEQSAGEDALDDVDACS